VFRLRVTPARRISMRNSHQAGGNGATPAAARQQGLAEAPAADHRLGRRAEILGWFD